MQGSIPSHLTTATKAQRLKDLKVAPKALYLMDIIGTIFYKNSFSLLSH